MSDDIRNNIPSLTLVEIQRMNQFSDGTMNSLINKINSDDTSILGNSISDLFTKTSNERKCTNIAESMTQEGVVNQQNIEKVCNQLVAVSDSFKKLKR